MNVQEDAAQLAESMDKGEDFLHQIRTKVSRHLEMLSGHLAKKKNVIWSMRHSAFTFLRPQTCVTTCCHK